MRIAVHDYSGHPFQVQLSRVLAGRGHDVTHLYSSSNPTTPTGALTRRLDDPECFSIEAVHLPKAVDKRAFVDRWRLERLYGRRLAARVARLRPEVVLLSGTPLDAGVAVEKVCRSQGIPLVYWLQDLLGEAAVRILSRELGTVGRVIGGYYRARERRLMRRSAHVVGITEDFRSVVEGMGLAGERYTTIPNWAPLDEIVSRPKENVWARRQGLHRSFVFLYSGNLGMKHNPALLLALAREFSDQLNVHIVVNAHGDAANWLRARAEGEGLSRIRVNGFQPYEFVSDVLGTGDVLLALLEPDAGVFSVPSKVLAYHGAGRPILLAVPEQNLAARIVREEGTGLVADPRNEAAFVTAARRLYEDAEMRRRMGERGRAYAETAFDIDRITDRFEEVISQALRFRETG